MKSFEESDASMLNFGVLCQFWKEDVEGNTFIDVILEWGKERVIALIRKSFVTLSLITRLLFSCLLDINILAIMAIDKKWLSHLRILGIQFILATKQDTQCSRTSPT